MGEFCSIKMAITPSLLFLALSATASVRASQHRPSSCAAGMSLVDSRRQMLLGLSTAAAGLATAAPAFAFGAKETEYDLTKDYPTDAKKMLANMKKATALNRGDADFETIVVGTRKEMTEFVAFYRRNTKIAGAPSYNTLYTAINTLSGHYASYGNKYPVPEERRKRLAQQYAEIDRALLRGR